MSRDPDDVNKLTESTYKNVMEQFNPGLRNLVNLGKSYEKAVTAMTLAGKAYFDAVSKIGENAAVSPVSRELGVVLMDISEVHKKVQQQLEESVSSYAPGTCPPSTQPSVPQGCSTHQVPAHTVQPPPPLQESECTQKNTSSAQRQSVPFIGLSGPSPVSRESSDEW